MKEKEQEASIERSKEFGKQLLMNCHLLVWLLVQLLYIEEVSYNPN